MVSEACIKKYAAHKFKKLMNVENERVQDVSYYCEIDREILCRYRDKGQFPNPWQLVLIADHFGCSVNELLGFDQSKSTNMHRATDVFPGENHFAEYLSNEITQRMNEINMTIEDLTYKIKSSRDTVERWFDRWPTLPKTTYLLRICDALNYTPTDLLGY